MNDLRILGSQSYKMPLSLFELRQSFPYLMLVSTVLLSFIFGATRIHACGESPWDYEAGFEQNFDGVDPLKDQWTQIVCFAEPSNSELIALSELSKELKISSEENMSDRIKAWLGEDYQTLPSFDVADQPGLDFRSRDARLFRAIERAWNLETPMLSEYETQQNFRKLRVLSYSRKNYKRFFSLSRNVSQDRVIHFWDLDSLEPRIIYTAPNPGEDNRFFRVFKAPWDNSEIVIAHGSKVFVSNIDEPNPSIRLLFDARDHQASVSVRLQMLDIRPLENGLAYRTDSGFFHLYLPLEKKSHMTFTHDGVMAYVYNPSKNKNLISVSAEKVMVWDTKTKDLIRSFAVGLTTEATAFVPKSVPSQLVLVSMVGAFLVYDIETGRELSNHYLSWGCTLYHPNYAVLASGKETLTIQCGDDDTSFYNYEPESMRLEKLQMGQGSTDDGLVSSFYIDSQSDRYVSWLNDSDELSVYKLESGALQTSWQAASMFDPSDAEKIDGFLFRYVSSNPFRPHELLSSSGKDLIALDLNDAKVRLISQASAGASKNGVLLVNETNPNVIVQIGASGDVKVWDFYKAARKVLDEKLKKALAK